MQCALCSPQSTIHCYSHSYSNILIYQFSPDISLWEPGLSFSCDVSKNIHFCHDFYLSPQLSPKLDWVSWGKHYFSGFSVFSSTLSSVPVNLSSSVVSMIPFSQQLWQVFLTFFRLPQVLFNHSKWTWLLLFSFLRLSLSFGWFYNQNVEMYSSPSSSHPDIIKSSVIMYAWSILSP